MFYLIKLFNSISNNAEWSLRYTKTLIKSILNYKFHTLTYDFMTDILESE